MTTMRCVTRAVSPTMTRRARATSADLAPPIGMAARIAVLAVLLLGCQNGSTPPDAVPPPDATIGVQCGSAVCAMGSPGCCTKTGGAPSCMATGDTCTGKVMGCDGPEDCTGGDTCCILNAGGTACETKTACAADGLITCNSDHDCGGDLPSCCNHMCANECSFW